MTWNRRAFGSRTVGDAVAAATHYPSPDESFEVPRSTDTPIGDAQDPRQAAYSKYLRTSGGGLLAVVLLLGCNAWAVTTRLAWCCLFQRVGHDHLMQGKAFELASSLTLGHRSSLRSTLQFLYEYTIQRKPWSVHTVGGTSCVARMPSEAGGCNTPRARISQHILTLPACGVVSVR